MSRSRGWVLVAVPIGTLVLAGGLMWRPSGETDESHLAPRAAAEPQPASTPSWPVACRELAASPPIRPGGDLVLGSANLITMDGHRRADGVTVREGRITDLRASGDAVIDLEGAAVLPGLIDSHSHWIGDRDLVPQSAPKAIAAALAQGWTSISELFADDADLTVLCTMERRGLLRLRVGAFLPLNYGFDRFGRPYQDFEPGQPFGPRLFVQGVKLFADGAEDGLGHQTDPPSRRVQGDLFWRRGELATEVRLADRAGWQVAIHATGDGGLDLALDAFEPLGREAIVEARHRVEHVSTVRDDQVRRMAELGLIASVQHSWFHADAVPTLTRWVGRDRRVLSGRWRDLVEAGVPLTGSTDRPWAITGTSGDSMDAISYAVTRVGRAANAPPAWMLAQRLTVWEVLRSLTIDAAFAQGTEESVGTIEVGKAGDLVVLSADPTRVPEAQLSGIEILATIVDGHVQFCHASVPRDLRPLCPA